MCLVPKNISMFQCVRREYIQLAEVQLLEPSGMHMYLRCRRLLPQWIHHRRGLPEMLHSQVNHPVALVSIIFTNILRNLWHWCQSYSQPSSRAVHTCVCE